MPINAFTVEPFSDVFILSRENQWMSVRVELDSRNAKDLPAMALRRGGIVLWAVKQQRQALDHINWAHVDGAEARIDLAHLYCVAPVGREAGSERDTTNLSTHFPYCR